MTSFIIALNTSTGAQVGISPAIIIPTILTLSVTSPMTGTTLLPCKLDLNNLWPVAIMDAIKNFCSAKFALYNIRFLNKKALYMNDVITYMGLDFLCFTETWQTSNKFMTLNETTPSGYEFINQPRLTGHEGRLAVLYHCCFKVRSVPLHDTSLFESLKIH